MEPAEARALVEQHGGIRAAARAIDMPYATFYYRLNKDDSDYIEMKRQRSLAWFRSHKEEQAAYRRRRWAEIPEVRKRKHEWGRKRYSHLRDQGLCTKCGKEPLLSDTRCWGCLNKMEERRAIAL